jgi:hypothetical protein
VCGFAVWQNTGKRVADAYDVDTKLDAFLSARFTDEDVKVVPLSRIVAELFEWIGGPVQIDVLVRILAYILDTREQQIESLDDLEINFHGNTRSTEADVETNEMLGRLWRSVKRLPPKQRDAFALRFQDQAGRDLLTVLLAAGIVEWKDLAKGLGRSAADIADLWMQMPMDSGTAASTLNTSRRNIYKWRFRAIRKLKAELGVEKSW